MSKVKFQGLHDQKNLKIKGQYQVDLLFDLKAIIHYNFVPPQKSTKHSTLKFWSLIWSQMAFPSFTFGLTNMNSAF
jgi:hypothetical protein